MRAVCCVPGVVITECLGWSSRTNDCWADLSCKVSLILIQDRPSGQESRKANSPWALTCFRHSARPFMWIISSNPHSPPIRWVFFPLHGWVNKLQCVRCWLFFFFSPQWGSRKIIAWISVYLTLPLVLFLSCCGPHAGVGALAIPACPPQGIIGRHRWDIIESDAWDVK